MTAAPLARTEEADSDRPSSFHRSDLVSAFLTATGLLLWAVSMAQGDLSEMNDLGIVSAMSLWFWLGLAGVVTGFVVALRSEEPRSTVVLLALVGLVLIVFGTPGVLEGTPRLEASYRHLGIIEQIQTSGQVDRTVDAYFNWPGFFAFFAMIGGAAGVTDLRSLATAAPVLAALAYLPPLVLIMRCLTTNVRLQWLAVAFFIALNWSGQDYFSPQAFAFWLYLSVLALLLRLAQTTSDDFLRPKWLRRRFPSPSDLPPNFRAGQGQIDRFTAATMMVLVVLGMMAITVSHQLTPFVLGVSLGVLWLVGRGQLWLVVFAASATILWLLIPAWPFVQGNIDVIVGGVGDAGGAAQANVSSRFLNGSPEHRIVVAGRMAEALAVWLLDLIGAFVLWRRRRAVAGPLMLFAAPFLLLPLQSYGGEMIIRVYLFSLPLTAYLAALALSRWTEWVPNRRTNVLRAGALTLVLLAVAGSTLVARYGNERGESFRPDEIAAVTSIYDRGDTKARVLALTSNTPWRFEQYSALEYDYVKTAEPGAKWARPLTVKLVLEKLRKMPNLTTYVLYTRSQSAMADLSANTTVGAVAAVADKLATDRRFEVLYQSTNGLVLRWLPDGG